MTEDQIERLVERYVDAIDLRYMAGKLSDAEYRDAMRAIEAWASRQYARPAALREAMSVLSPAPEAPEP